MVFKTRKLSMTDMDMKSREDLLLEYNRLAEQMKVCLENSVS